jgi:hypothetical protein
VAENAATQLRELDVAVLRGVFAKDSLIAFRDAATRCFEAIETDSAFTEYYKFNRFSHSIPLAALADFGCDDLMQPLSAPGLDALISQAMGNAWSCKLEQSWVRKKFAPMLAPASMYSEQGWHQDGALGVQFPNEPGPTFPMTELLTCWIPLDACGRESPGLEFVRGRQAGLLHFSELDDAALRRRFRPEDFLAPELELGDGLVFLNSVLHRTYTRPEMRRNRLSIEYRIFPRSFSC